jgi:hypothetical protein
LATLAVASGLGLVAPAPVRAAACSGTTACGAVTGVTYNGVAMTSLGSATNGDVRVEVFYMKAPPTGAHSVVVTGSVPTDITASSISLTGVDQTSGTFANQNGAIGTSATASAASITAAKGDVLVDFMGAVTTTTPTLATGTAQTIRTTNTTATGVNHVVSGSSTSFGNSPTATTMQWATGGSGVDWAEYAVDVHFSSALTGVDLESLRATWQGADTLIQWNTGYQPDVVGYYVFRSAGAGPRTQLNGELIEGGALAGAQSAFSWTDGTPGWNGPVSYWVQEVWQDGSVKWYGPANPMVPATTPDTTPDPTASTIDAGATSDASLTSGPLTLPSSTGAGGAAASGAAAESSPPSTGLNGAQGGCAIVSHGRPLTGLRLFLALGLVASTRWKRRRWIGPAFFAAMLVASGLWHPRQAAATGGVSVDATATATGANGLTFSHTMGSGANGLLLVGVITPIQCTTTTTDGANCGTCGTTCASDTASLSSGLLGLWHFDEGTGTTSADSSGNGNTASLLGTTKPTWEAGYSQNAVQMNGTSSYVQAPLGTWFGGNNSHTASAWVYVTSNTNGPVFGVSSTPPGGGWNMPFLSIVGTTVYGWTYNGTSLSATGLSTNAWHLLVLTYDQPSSTTTFYVDGVSKGTTTGAFSGAGATTPVYLSSLLTGVKPATMNNYFLGRLDEVRAYNRALSSAEVTTLFGARLACASSTCAACTSGKTSCSGSCVDTTADNSNCGSCGHTCNTAAGESCMAGVCGCSSGTDCSTYCVTTTTDSNNCGGCNNVCSIATPTSVNTGLIGLWHLDEGTGTTTADSSGTGNTGTLTSSAMWTTAGYSSNAVSFDGTNYLTASLGTWFGSNNNLTASAWVYATSTSSGPVFGVTNTLPGTGWNMPFLAISGSTVYGHIWSTVEASGGAHSPQSATVSLNAWHHLAITYNTTAGEAFYVDGALSSSLAMTYSPSNAIDYLTTHITGYTQTGVNPTLTGKIDDLRAWTRTLSAAEIAMVANSRQTCAASTCGGCTGGETLCSSVCTNTNTDSGNCGSCGHACNTAGGETCTGGTCGCSGSLMDCSAVCIDTTSDNHNCGSCGNVCGTTTCASCSQGYVGLWHFDEGTGTTSADSSGNGRTATLSSTSDWTASGELNAGLSFTNGTDFEQASLGTAFSTNTTLSAAAWVFATSTTNGAIFGVSAVPSGQSWNMPFLSIAGGASTSTVFGHLWQVNMNTPLSATVSNNAWHFLVVTYDPLAGENFYVDGALSASATGTYAPVGAGFTDYFTTQIGGTKPAGVTNKFFVGKMDEVSAYNRVLSAGEIKLLYDARQTCSGSSCTPCPSGMSTCSGVCTNLLADQNNCNACGTVCTSGQTCIAGACM